jgi:tRNA (guanine37-N1)-methyltransferase
MHISIVSVFPELYTEFLNTSLIKRAQEQEIVSVSTQSYFSYVAPKERIDAPSFGHGAGMLIKPAVIQKAVEDHEGRYGNAYKIFFSPHGRKLDQHLLKELAVTLKSHEHIMLMPGRYEGMDSRVEQEYADMMISVGDFVLMGGDVPAMMFLEGVLRLIPGVVGKQESVEQDSFYKAFVDYPEYTEPVEWKDHQVPSVIRSGNHGLVTEWRLDKAAERTVFHHFAWLRSQALTPQETNFATKHIPPHYIVLMHSDVYVGSERQLGTTSVTSLDIHDIARSAKTFGFKNFFLVTPLQDQQMIVKTLLGFWQEGDGVEYNHSRHTAVSQVRLMSNLNEVISAITEKEGKPPLLVATSAREVSDVPHITFNDQEQVWQEKRPVLFIFGTGQGLSDQLVRSCNYLLTPIHGFSLFNHLSVRSAVAIALDRWLGINEKYIDKHWQK